MARQPDPLEPRRENGQLNAAISEALVRMLADTTGRGPTKARTTIDRDLIVVMLQNTLTPGERYLAGSDRAEQVLAMRRAYRGEEAGGRTHAPARSLASHKKLARQSRVIPAKAGTHEHRPRRGRPRRTPRPPSRPASLPAQR